MSVRIRYFETNEPGIIQSVKMFQHPTNGARYKVRINEKELEYHVIEDMSDTVSASGRAANLHQVKIKAKKTLQELGIEFEETEKRARTPKALA
jgi:hypothetical protein